MPLGRVARRYPVFVLLSFSCGDIFISESEIEKNLVAFHGKERGCFS